MLTGIYWILNLQTDILVGLFSIGFFFYPDHLLPLLILHFLFLLWLVSLATWWGILPPPLELLLPLLGIIIGFVVGYGLLKMREWVFGRWAIAWFIFFTTSNFICFFANMMFLKIEDSLRFFGHFCLIFIIGIVAPATIASYLLVKRKEILTKQRGYIV